MTPLRQTMIQAMCQHGFSPRTQHSYLYVVTALTRYYRRSPDQLKVEDLQVFFNYLVQERSLSPASCRVYLHGIRFLYLKVLHWAHFDVTLVLPKRPQRIPELLTRQEVARLLAAVLNPKHQALLSVTYGCGLRVSEAVALRVKDIDGERHLLRIEQGKGAKDRMVPLAPGVLQALRRYWRIRHPMLWLFPSDLLPDRHQLERGLPIHELQRLLGHSDLRSTQRYLHWLPGVTPQNGGPADLIANLGGA